MTQQNVIPPNEPQTTSGYSSLALQFQTLNTSLDELLHLLQEYPEEQLNERPSPEGWSALQVCHHLLKSEELALCYLRKKLSFNPKLKPANMATKMRKKLLLTYLSTPIKYRAPAAVGDDVLPVWSSLHEVEKHWKMCRHDFAMFLSQLPEDVFDKEVYKHPFAGRLCLEGMLHFFEQHFNRHVKQIKRTLRRVS
jgi:hypothetical protein